MGRASVQPDPDEIHDAHLVRVRVRARVGLGVANPNPDPGRSKPY